MSWDFFIRRPIFGTVLSLIVVMAGLMAFRLLPVSQYPQIAPPTATIAISYPGASAETLMRTVAAPIEDEINGTDNLLYYSSTSSSNGLLTITVTFEPGSDPDLAVINLTNRVKVAEPRLPDEARRLGIVVKKRSNDILMSISVISKDGSRDSVFLSNYAAVNIVEEIKRVPGISDAGILAPATIRCASGCAPTRWPSLASRQVTWLAPSAPATTSTPRAVSGRSPPWRGRPS